MQNGGCRYHGNSGPPTKSRSQWEVYMLKFHVNRFTTFRAMSFENFANLA